MTGFSSDEAIERHVEDRRALSASELDGLVAALRRDSALCADVRRLLMIDELIDRALSTDRGDFAARMAEADPSR
ncbi:MAG TPA: hypothetical protein VEL07_11765 [Planctomycetota bacterium]|nr:hypothetical protein [Planctomycetota bacterium]